MEERITNDGGTALLLIVPGGALLVVMGEVWVRQLAKGFETKGSIC
jgi:hypothetical protein